MNTTPHVTVIDDDPNFRCAVVRLLDTEHYSTSAFESAEQFLSAYPCVDARAPQCLLLDLRMPGMGGLALQSRLPEYGIDSPVIVITGVADVALAVRAMRAGAVNVLEKPVAGPELLDAVRQAMVVDEPHRSLGILRASRNERLKLLTEREGQTLLLMLEGKNNKTVARQFEISIQTAAKHTARVLHKMGAANAFELIASFLKLHDFASSQQAGMPRRPNHPVG